jgi:hypothetical protein
MKLYSLNAVAIALVVLSVLGVVVPTAAVHGGDHDQVFSEGPDVSLYPADGPNGDYATIGDDGNLSVSIPNANLEADTRIDGVFLLANHENTSIESWITHDGTDAVDLYVGDGRSIQGRTSNVTLAPGDTREVGLSIDGTGREAGDQLLSTVQLHARYDESEVYNEGSTMVEIGFDDGTDLSQNVTELDPGYLDDVVGEPSDPDLTAPPKAVINRTTGEGLAFSNELSDAELDGWNADAVVRVGENVSLSGSRSLLNTSYAVDSDRRLVSLLDIPVPEGREETPATIRVPIDPDRLGSTNASQARLARLTDDGWQLLETAVVDRGGSEMTLQARTPGFSIFGVFAEDGATYTWERGNRTITDRTAEFNLTEPGLEEVNLTITDAFGQTDTTTYRILANDRPAVEVERPEEITPNESVTLRANVTDEVGNATVTWQFADGSTALGRTVERTFDRGEHDVTVSVEDELGANVSAETTLFVGVAPDQGGPGLDVVQWTLGFEGRIVAVVLVSVLVLAGLRWLLARRYYREDRTRTRSRD